MTTRRELILSNLATTLGTIPGINGRIYRSRIEPISRNQSPAVIIEPSQDQADVPDAVGRINWKMNVKVIVFVRAQVPDQAADPYVQQVHAKILSDETAGGYASGIKPLSTSFDFVEADQPAGMVTSEFEVFYQTAYGDLSSV